MLTTRLSEVQCEDMSLADVPLSDLENNSDVSRSDVVLGSMMSRA